MKIKPATPIPSAKNLQKQNAAANAPKRNKRNYQPWSVAVQVIRLQLV